MFNHIVVLGTEVHYSQITDFLVILSFVVIPYAAIQMIQSTDRWWHSATAYANILAILVLQIVRCVTFAQIFIYALDDKVSEEAILTAICTTFMEIDFFGATFTAVDYLVPVTFIFAVSLAIGYLTRQRVRSKIVPFLKGENIN